MERSMKNLYLLRHAKSSWQDSTLPDLERPLNKRGKRDAARMGKFLGARLAPLKFHVSPAKRAQHTFIGIAKFWEGLKKNHCVTTTDLYTFSVRELLDWIARQPPDIQDLALIGHNPALTDLVNFLVGSKTIDNLPTGGWIELIVSIQYWSTIESASGKGSLTYALMPRELPND